MVSQPISALLCQQNAPCENFRAVKQASDPVLMNYMRVCQSKSVQRVFTLGSAGSLSSGTSTTAVLVKICLALSSPPNPSKHPPLIERVSLY